MNPENKMLNTGPGRLLCLSKDDWDTRCGRKQQLMYAFAREFPDSRIAYAMPPRVSFGFLRAFQADNRDWPSFLEPPDNLALFSSFRPPLDRFDVIRDYGRKARCSALFKAAKPFFQSDTPDVLWAYNPWDHVVFENKKTRWLKVFDFTDDWSRFKPESLRDTRRIADAQRRVIEKADVVFGVAEPLCQIAREFNSNVHLLPNATNPDHFSPAEWKDRPLPDDCRDLKHPVLGWAGNIGSYFDFELAHYLADEFPEATILLVGGYSQAAEGLKQHSNVRLIGHKSHAEIPNYVRCFDVCIAPYRENTPISPTKLYEYIAAEKPVVARVTEAMAGSVYKHILHVVTKEDFVNQVRLALSGEGGLLPYNEKEKFLFDNSWRARALRAADILRQARSL